MNTRAVRWIVTLVTVAAAQSVPGTGPRSPEQLGAHWARLTDRSQLDFLAEALRSAPRQSASGRLFLSIAGSAGVEGLMVAGRSAPARGDVVADVAAAAGRLLNGTPGTYSVGSTFIETPISDEHGVERLTRTVTRSKLGRALFSTPGATASYYVVRYSRSAPFVHATYVQFVADAAWNRIVYGNVDRWIRSYDNVSRPTSIAVDGSGRVFIAETGRRRVNVLRIEGEGDAVLLRPSFTIDGAVAALAHSDGGTPLDPADDLLYLADPRAGTVLRYRIPGASAVLTGTFEGFDSPTAIAVGRWNGANTRFVYVVDNVAKRLRVFEDTGHSLEPVGEYRGRYEQYFSSITTDHFGNVYLADNTGSTLSKFTAGLEPLDEEGGADLYGGLSAVDVPFGRIDVEGEEPRWAGFDQLFAVERWSAESGARRRTLGLRLKDISFTTDEDASAVTTGFVLTDFGTVSVGLADASGRTVRTLAASAMVSGRKRIVWDRRDDEGKLVPPGDYVCTLSATSPYREEAVTTRARWSLPLYYEETGAGGAPHLVQGALLQAGGRIVAADQHAVVYRFPDLKPGSGYAVAAEYVSPDGEARIQNMTAGDGLVIHADVQVGPAPGNVGYFDVPRAAYASGVLTLSINRRSGSGAVVARLVLKETDNGFDSRQEETVLPDRYALEQSFPNPFNPSAVIRYALPEAGPVTLVVYDIAGREVARLVDGHQAAGTYEVRFDGRAINPAGIASGVYLYRLTAGRYTQTRKMAYVR